MRLAFASRSRFINYSCSPSQTSAASPSTTSPTQSFPPSGDAPSPVRRMLIRTDLHQSAETNSLTAMLELPGVKKTDIRVALSVDPFSGIKQLTVTGRSALRFPHESEGWYLVRERKYGEFKRVLVVPPDTKVRSSVDSKHFVPSRTPPSKFSLLCQPYILESSLSPLRKFAIMVQSTYDRNPFPPLSNLI